MNRQDLPGLETYLFHDLHPGVFLGTASDRYVGWIGQIYSKTRYEDKITNRSKRVGKQVFQEETLPVESVEEYFQHFPILELDFTFYSLLLDKELKPTQNYHVLRRYQQYLREGNALFVKVPQVIFARKLWRGSKFIENSDYLDPDLFRHRFYEPAVDLIGDALKGFIFEQEYQPKKERISPQVYASSLDCFFKAIPEDERYHVETRTESLLLEPYFQVLENYGVGQVLSHWTWLPSLLRQFKISGGRFLNASNQALIRLVTPLRMRYAETFEKAFPFNEVVDGMMSPQMVPETVEVMIAALEQGIEVNVIINNRSGGNAPIMAQKFLRGIFVQIR